ncbi:MAG: ASPIC/UnbV domain-containing protein, partial [Planctomycetes bacterium]|nr:ASPIC/UnbV domain-containing protein [Planctomycetota bacterium]
ARITVEFREDGVTRRVFRHVNSGGSFGANPLRVHLGLGRAERIERLLVDWPGGSGPQVFESLPLDRELRIVEGKGAVEDLTRASFRLGGR